MAQCGCGHTKNTQGNCDGTHLTLKNDSEKQEKQEKKESK